MVNPEARTADPAEESGISDLPAATPGEDDRLPTEGPTSEGTAQEPLPPPPCFGGGYPTILQVIPSLVTGGAERGCIDMAAAIQQAGGRALVVSSGGSMSRELERCGARHIDMPVASKNPLTIRANATRLADLIRNERVDLIHARSRAPAWSAWLAARRTGIPYVTTFHAPYNFKNRLKQLYNSVMARGDRVIAVSAFVADHVASQYGVRADRLRTIPRGIDIELMRPDRVTQARMIALSRAWRLPDDKHIVMLPGRLSRWKGQSVLIQAMARLNRSNVLALLVGADQGRDAYRQELEEQVRTLGLEGRVSIVGHCNDMAAAYMLADLVVSTSVEPEAFGRVIVEAQAMGRPVIVSDIGAVRETVVNGTTGLVVPPGDPDALTAALITALDLDPLQRRAVGLDAMQHARSHFTRERMCSATLAVYAELLPAGRAVTTEEPKRHG
jgi:glycosyltransferase involved in cell wall biosynthesis